MITLRRVKALVLGHSQDISCQLEASAVPITEADCRTCSEPCTEGHESYPSRFDVDRETQMLGSVKPYRRQVVISTGKSDWDRDIASTKGSLASYLSATQSKRGSISSSPSSESRISKAPGIFDAADATRISILNGSHDSISEDCSQDTVLIFPDYVLVSEVPRTLEGAQRLWDGHIDPIIGRSGVPIDSLPNEKKICNTWIIPYSCVILLCSHKRRDNRCSIAAAKLGTAFTQCLEHRGWTVDTQLDHPSHSQSAPLEEFTGSEEDREDHLFKLLQELPAEKKALIVRNSHMGGHRFAGNCIIYTPQGSGIWYGRVSPHEVESIVTNTLEEGVILPPLLRGGVNISRPGCKSLNDW